MDFHTLGVRLGGALFEASLSFAQDLFLSQVILSIQQPAKEHQQVEGQNQEVGLDIPSSLAGGPGLGFLQLVLGGVEHLFDAPAQQVEPGHHTGSETHVSGQELVAGAGLRIRILDEAHAVASIEADEPIGVDPTVDRILWVEAARPVVSGGEVLLEASDHERSGLPHRSLLIPEGVIDEGRIGDDQGRRVRSAPSELTAKELRPRRPKHGHLMAVVTISLDGGKVEEQAAMEAEQIQGVGSDMTPLVVSQRMAGVLDLVTIHRPDGAAGQLREGSEQILLRGGWVMGIELKVELGEKSASAVGMETIEEGRARQRLVEYLGVVLQEIPPASDLTQGAEESLAQEVLIGDDWARTGGSGVVLKDKLGGGEELIQKCGVGVGKGVYIHKHLVYRYISYCPSICYEKTETTMPL